MTLKIKKLQIQNFAGISSEEFEFDGNNARIYGANESGKTSTATSLQWLLFDKGLDGSTKSFSPVPLHADSTEKYELIPTVYAEFIYKDKLLTIKKESHPKYTTNQKTNRKEYSRSRTKKQYINDESLKVKDFRARIAEIVDEDVFKLVTNPLAFNQLDWKECRKILFEIADPIDDIDIIRTNDNFKNISDILGEHDIDTKKKILSDKIKQINKDITDIPVRINQTERNKQEVPEYDNERYEGIKQELEQLTNKRIEVQNGGAEVELRNQLADKQAELKRIEDNSELDNTNKIHALNNELSVENGTVLNLKNSIKNNKRQMEHEEKRRQELLAEHKELNAEIEKVQNKKFEHSEKEVCSCCGQTLPEEKIKESQENALKQFNLEKSREIEFNKAAIEKVISEGKKIKPVIEKLESENNDLQIRVNEANDKAQRIQDKINKLKASSVDVNQTEQYKSVLNEINEINTKRKDIRATVNDELKKIDESIEALENEKKQIDNAKAIEESNKHLDQSILDLRDSEDSLLDQKEIYAEQLFILKEFTTTKVNMLTDNINSKFKIAEFKLFNQLVNGDLEETCVTTVKGVEYGAGLNNASKVNVGLDIINTLSTHYKFTAPIFIDNAESVTNIINTDAQQVQLVVSAENKKLRMETI